MEIFRIFNWDAISSEWIDTVFEQNFVDYALLEEAFVIDVFNGEDPIEILRQGVLSPCSVF